MPSLPFGWHSTGTVAAAEVAPMASQTSRFVVCRLAPLRVNV